MNRSAKKALYLAVGGVCIPVVLPAAAHAQTPTVTTWQATGGGSYTNPANWTNGVPQNSGPTIYEALFANANEPTKNFTVTLTQSVTASAIIDNLSNFNNNTLLFAASSSAVNLDLTGMTYNTEQNGTVSNAITNVILANDNTTQQTNALTLGVGVNVPLQNSVNTIVTSGNPAGSTYPYIEIDSNISDGNAGTSSAVNIYGGGNGGFDGGIVYFAGSNSYSGGTTIGNAAGTEGGALQLAPDVVTGSGTAVTVTQNSLGTGNVVINEQGQLLLYNNTTSNGTLYYLSPSQTLVINGIGVNKTTSGNIRTYFGPNISAKKSTVTFTMLSNIEIGSSLPSEGYNGDVIISATSQADNVIKWAGVVSGLPGSVGIDKQGSGSLEFSNPSNTFTGQMQIGNGDIYVDAGSSMGTGDLEFAQTSTNFVVVDLYNAQQNIGSLSSTFLQGSLANNGAPGSAYQQTLNLLGPGGAAGTNIVLHQDEDTAFGYTAQAGFNTLTSVIQDGLSTSTGPGEGTLTLAVGSTGTLTLNGSNTYSGGTYINGGTLNVANGTGTLINLPNGGQTLHQFPVNAGSATGFGDVYVNNGGMLTSGNNTEVLGVFMNDGSIGADVNVASGGTVNPGGVNLAGTLYIAGNLTAAPGAIFDADLVGGTTANSDLTVVGGALNTTGTATLSISGSSLAFGNYTLFQANSLTNGTASFDIGSTPTPIASSIKRSYNLLEVGSNVVLQVLDIGTDRFWSVGGGNPASDGSGTWGVGGTNFFTQSGSSSITQNAYTNSFSADVIIGASGSGGNISLVSNVEVNGPLVFGQVSTPYTISGTNSLQLDAGIVSSNTTNISAPVVLDSPTGTSTFTTSIGTTLNLSGGIGEISGPQTLVTGDLGTIVLGGTGSYTGGTQVNQGVLQVTTTSLPSIGTATVAAGAQLTFGQSLSGSFGGLISGDGKVVINNTNHAVTILSNTANAYTGTTVLNGGVLSVDNIGELGTGDGGIEMGGGTLQFNAANLNFPLSAGHTITTTITLDSNSTSVVDTQNFTGTLGQVLQGSGNLTKIGAGTLAFTSIHSTNEIGSLAILGGALAFDEPGTPSFGFSGSVNGTGLFTGDLDIDQDTDVRIYGGDISGGGNINIPASGAGSIIEGRDTNGVFTTNIGNSINLTGGNTLEIFASAIQDTLILSGGITGNGNVDYTAGNGLTLLSGTSTYTGTTTVDYGNSPNGLDVQLGINNAMPSGTDLHVTGSGLLDMGGFSQQVASLTGSTNAMIQNLSGTTTSILTISGSAVTTYSGYLLDGNFGTLGLTLGAANTGWLTLAGSEVLNTFATGMSGPITILGGRLQAMQSLGALGAPSYITVGSEVGNSQLRFEDEVGTLTYASVANPSSAPSPIILTGVGGYTPVGGNYHPGAIDVENGSNLYLPSSITLAASSDIGVDSTSFLTVQGDVTGPGGLELSNLGTMTLSGNNTYGGPTTVDTGATLIAATALPTGNPIGNNGVVSLFANNTVGQVTGTGLLNIGQPSLPVSVTFASNSHTSTVGALNINAGSQLDVKNNALQINFGSPASDPIATVVSELTSGYSAATVWTGTSGTSGVITSSTAVGSHTVTLGYLDGNVDTGQPAVQANQILVKYTLVGDSDLSGEVDFTDLASVLKHFNQSGTDWAQGNFEYAANSPSIASTNFNDLADVLKNFLQTTPGGSSGETLGGKSVGLSTTVQILETVPGLPEPTSLSLVAAGAAGLLARRRRRTIV